MADHGSSPPKEDGKKLEITECKHTVRLETLCAICGVEIKDSQELMAAIHSSDKLLQTQKNAKSQQKIRNKELYSQKKLILILDLDQTVLHTTNHMDDCDFSFSIAKSVFYVKFRPHLFSFLKKLSKIYEIHVYTMGTREYASIICKEIDPDGLYFGDRIVSRSENFNELKKSIERITCISNNVVILDDRADVWDFSKNVVMIRPFWFYDKIDLNDPKLLKQKADAQLNDKNMASSITALEKYNKMTDPSNNSLKEDIIMKHCYIEQESVIKEEDSYSLNTSDTLHTDLEDLLQEDKSNTSILVNEDLKIEYLAKNVLSDDQISSNESSLKIEYLEKDTFSDANNNLKTEYLDVFSDANSSFNERSLLAGDSLKTEYLNVFSDANSNSTERSLKTEYLEKNTFSDNKSFDINSDANIDIKCDTTFDHDKNIKKPKWSQMDTHTSHSLQDSSSIKLKMGNNACKTSCATSDKILNSVSKNELSVELNEPENIFIATDSNLIEKEGKSTDSNLINEDDINLGKKNSPNLEDSIQFCDATFPLGTSTSFDNNVSPYEDNELTKTFKLLRNVHKKYFKKKKKHVSKFFKLRAFKNLRIIASSETAQLVVFLGGIIVNDSPDYVIENTFYAKKFKVPNVDIAWIYECIYRRKLLDPAVFFIEDFREEDEYERELVNEFFN